MVSNVTILPFSLLRPHWPSTAVSRMLFGLRAFALAVWSWVALPPSICVALPSSLQAPWAGPTGMVLPAGRGAEGFSITSRRTPPPHSSLSLSPASSYQKGPDSYRPLQLCGVDCPPQQDVGVGRIHELVSLTAVSPVHGAEPRQADVPGRARTE